MPKADWKKCAVCMALPTTQTSGVPAGDRERVGRGVVLDQADELLELVEVELGQPLVVVEGLLEAHGRASRVGGTVPCARTHPPRQAGQAAPPEVACLHHPG